MQGTFSALCHLRKLPLNAKFCVNVPCWTFGLGQLYLITQ